MKKTIFALLYLAALTLSSCALVQKEIENKQIQDSLDALAVPEAMYSALMDGRDAHGVNIACVYSEGERHDFQDENGSILSRFLPLSKQEIEPDKNKVFSPCLVLYYGYWDLNLSETYDFFYVQYYKEKSLGPNQARHYYSIPCENGKSIHMEALKFALSQVSSSPAQSGKIAFSA